MNSQKLYTFILSLLIFIFLLAFAYVHMGLLRPLRADFEQGQKQLEEIRREQEGQMELVDQIERYREGLYVLNLLLEARKNVISGSDEENPYLVFSFPQLLDDLRQLLPKDAKVTRFQVNSKGLLTLLVESVDYASLGRVLRSFKDSAMFTLVQVPSGVQRIPRQVQGERGSYFENVYSFTLQATLNPDFWNDPMPYADVSPSAYYAQAIRDLTIGGLIEGYSSGLFEPDKPISQEEFFRIALRQSLASGQLDLETFESAVDLSGESWIDQHAELSSRLGLPAFADPNPSGSISRIEALEKILALFVQDSEKKVTEDESGESGGSEEDRAAPKVPFPFGDVAPEDEFYPLVELALKQGVLQAGGAFRPRDSVTRAEAAYWVWKMKF